MTSFLIQADLCLARVRSIPNGFVVCGCGAKGNECTGCQCAQDALAVINDNDANACPQLTLYSRLTTCSPLSCVVLASHCRDVAKRTHSHHLDITSNINTSHQITRQITPQIFGYLGADTPSPLVAAANSNVGWLQPFPEAWQAALGTVRLEEGPSWRPSAAMMMAAAPAAVAATAPVAAAAGRPWWDGVGWVVEVGGAGKEGTDRAAFWASTCRSLSFSSFIIWA